MGKNRWIKTRGRILLAAAIAAASVASQAKTASADDIRTDRADAQRTDAMPLAGPWWRGFGESALASLQQAARSQSGTRAVMAQGGRAMTVDAQVATAYVAMRTYNVRWLIATKLIESLDRQRQILAGSAPVASMGNALATVDDRRAKAQRMATVLLAQRDAAIAALASLTGSTPQEIANEMQAALAIPDMPTFNADTPDRLPRSVLMARGDVSASQGQVALGRRFSAEASHQAAIGAASLAGWIDAASSIRTVPTQTTSMLPDVQELMAVAAQAETEISADLADLQRRTVETTRLVEIVKTRQLDLEAARRRMGVGAADEHEVIKGLQALLVNDDELAMSAGELAYAWIRLQSSTGGQALQARGLSDE